MENFLFCLLVQANLIFGIAGLIWPEKLTPYFAVLMFPWPVTDRAIRLHGVVAVGAYLLVLAKFLAFGPHF